MATKTKTKKANKAKTKTTTKKASTKSKKEIVEEPKEKKLPFSKWVISMLAEGAHTHEQISEMAKEAYPDLKFTRPVDIEGYRVKHNDKCEDGEEVSRMVEVTSKRGKVSLVDSNELDEDEIPPLTSRKKKTKIAEESDDVEDTDAKEEVEEENSTKKKVVKKSSKKSVKKSTKKVSKKKK